MNLIIAEISGYHVAVIILIILGVIGAIVWAKFREAKPAAHRGGGVVIDVVPHFDAMVAEPVAPPDDEADQNQPLFHNLMNYQAIHNALNEGQQFYAPNGWSIINATNGANRAGSGLFLIPAAWEGQGWLNLPYPCAGFPVIGMRKIIFELFRLDAGGLKLSARCRYRNGNELFPSFTALQNLALGFECPQPENRNAVHTKSVAAWPQVRPNFAANDCAGIANWLSIFLANPPQDFTAFVNAVPKTLQQNP